MAFKRSKHKVKFERGDIVQLNEFWNNKVGLVRADDTAWYVIKKHWDIAHCICLASDVVKVLHQRAIPKRFLKYC